MKPQQNPIPHERSESELSPLLTAWDQAHPDAADPEWRHLLDELAHPRTTEAFYRLADTRGGLSRHP
ncbi:hypothetical protein ABZT17_27515 [Streptomyces sp. NPDC005648]|uniref:hypothetical protein n=1 Tax=Streptomyces sp. NPDC005648 TaxID=3157044 RepID=UPI0033A507CB